MSAKVMYSPTDEKQDLHRQIGCMAGIFQIFDRRYFHGQRRSGHNQKRLPAAGQSKDAEMDFNNASEQPTEKSPKKVEKDKQRVSLESSRNSFSSSCSSTFSSIDCSKKAQTEPPSYCQSIVPEKQPKTSLQPLDLRDVVKDSMYKESHVLSVKTMAKEKRTGPTMKHIDSPRPLQQPKPAQPRANSCDKTDQNLAKLRDGSWGSTPLTTKVTPRFSYDERESRDILKAAVKSKELPRLSLDGRQSSIRSTATESRRNNLARDIQRGEDTSGQMLNLNQEPGSNKRPSGVVARLIGLEVLPDSFSATEGETPKIKPCLDEDLVAKYSQVSGSPRVTKEPASPRMQIGYDITKLPSSSRLPVEPAPWKRETRNQGSVKPVFKHKEALAKTEHVSSSVYGEMEKRLTDLEFKKSGKDLRALKQILEAMQKTKRKLENEERPLNIESQTSKCSSDYATFDQRRRLPTWQSQQGNHQVSPAIKPAKFIGRHKHPDSMAVSGFQKLRKGDLADDRKELVGRRKTKDITPRHNHLKELSKTLPSTDRHTNAKTQRSALPSKMFEEMTREKSPTFRRSSGTVSPRLQGTEHGMDNQSGTHAPVSDLSRVRRQPNLQQFESDSTSRRLKPKSTNSLQKNGQSYGLSSETRYLSQQGDTVSMQSESNASLASQNETEVTSTDWSCEINSTYQPKDPKVKKIAARLVEGRPMAELATATMEQPSPVSVLDASFCAEDSPSPVKKISNAFKDDDTIHFDEAEWNQVGVGYLVNSTSLNQCSEFNHVKLENIKHLVHQIELLNSTHDEAAISLTAYPCENKRQHHRYISEILLASGLLEDLSCSTTITQLHPSGHLINPNLFHLLEKPNGNIELGNEEHHGQNAWSKSNEKIRRKLVFDTINDILVRKLAMAGSSQVWNFPHKPRGRTLSGEKLLKELYSEIDRLQANSERGLEDEDDEVLIIISKDVNHNSEDWEECRYEVPGLVLDIERLIFKDLISEVVSGEVPGLQDWPGRHCRQLFSK